MKLNKSDRRSGCRRPTAGFSILEITITTALTSGLLILMSGFSANLGRTMTDTIAQARLVSEANLAAECFKRDFRGSLPGEELGEAKLGLMVGQLNVSGAQARVCYDNDLDGRPDWGGPDDVIIFRRIGNQLIRANVRDGTTYVVANHVSNFFVTTTSRGLRLNVQFSYREFTRDYQFETVNP